MIIRIIKMLATGKKIVKDKSKKALIKKWIKRMLIAQLVPLIPYIVAGLLTITMCIVISATVSTMLMGNIGDLASNIGTSASTNEKCSCGDCKNATLIESTSVSSLNLDYNRLLSNNDSSEILYIAQVTQLCEALQNENNFPAVLLVYAMQHMESSGLTSASVMMQDGRYNIYRYSCKDRWVSVPGGRIAHNSAESGRPNPWYNHGAYGFLQIEGDEWVSGEWTREGISRVTKDNGHLYSLKARASEIIATLNSIGHTDIYGEYTNISGTKNGNFDEMLVDMGYLPFQIATAVYDSMTASTYSAGAEIFSEYWGEMTENEKRVAQCICLLARWNGGNFNMFDDRSERCNKTYQKFVIDIVKYLTNYGSSKFFESGSPNSLLSGSNMASSENLSAFKWLAGQLYGTNSSEYTEVCTMFNSTLFSDSSRALGTIYCIKAIVCAQSDMNNALSKLGYESVDIYNLALDGSGKSITVKMMSCGCTVPCPYCSCHGEYNGNTAEALDKLVLANDTSGFAYETLSMTNNVKAVIEGGITQWSQSVFGRDMSQARNAAITSRSDVLSMLNLTVVEIQCWDWKGANTDEIIANNFDKVTCSRKIVVASELANTVKQMFADIYRHPTKPIVGFELYSFRDIALGSESTQWSLHSFGIAIDVNHCGYRDCVSGVEFNGAYNTNSEPECNYIAGFTLPYSGTSKLCHGSSGSSCGACGKHLGITYATTFASNHLWSYVKVNNNGNWHVYSNGYVYAGDIQLVSTDSWYDDYKLIADTSYASKKLMQKMMTEDGVITKIMNMYGFSWNLGDNLTGGAASDAMHYGFVGRQGRGCTLEALAADGDSRNPLSAEFWKAENWPDTTEGLWNYSGVGPSSKIRGNVSYFDGVTNIYDEQGNNIASSVKSDVN